MVEGCKPTATTEGSAYSDKFTLHRNLYAALQALSGSEAMRSILGDNFIGLYCAVKEDEYRSFRRSLRPGSVRFSCLTSR